MPEAAAFGPQHIDRLLDLLRFACSEPGAECEYALLRGARHDDAGIAEDFRHIGAGAPGHQYLRLRHQQRFQAIAFGLQRADLVAADVSRFACGPACAHQHHHRKNAEEDKSERQREGSDILMVCGQDDAAQRIEQARRLRFRRCARAVKRDGDECCGGSVSIRT